MALNRQGVSKQSAVFAVVAQQGSARPLVNVFSVHGNDRIDGGNKHQGKLTQGNSRQYKMTACRKAHRSNAVGADSVFPCVFLYI